jgi:hypothetical protein
MKKTPLETLALRYLKALGEHADTVVILASVPSPEPNGKTELISVWQGNQFAAEYMASNFSTREDEEDEGEDEDEDDGDQLIGSENSC